MFECLRMLLFSLGTLALLCSGHCGGGKGKLAEFRWMLGKWKMEAGETYFVEEWKQINDSTFESSGYKYPAQDTAKKTALEPVRLIAKNGEVFYVPTVGEQKPVYYKFAGMEKEEYKFENKEQGFPQRIFYKPVSKKELYARVEGVLNERGTALEFEYNRVE